MLFPRFTALTATIAALVARASADGLQIISPGGPDLWWVASSINVISWTCHESPFQNFTVIVANQNPQIAPMPIIAVENNFDCSKQINVDQYNAVAGSGYLIQLASTLNITDIYATSQPFEVKPVGSAYPPASATPQLESSTASPSQTGSPSGSGSGAQQTNKPNSASKLTGAGAAAAAAAVFGIFFA